ncbi:MAG TPA: spore germination protein GerW family protein [Thermoanaerobaculia bacterium]|nr:spore germination protein GerW family protein [Thermoanaerobaculia bacterium]
MPDEQHLIERIGHLIQTHANAKQVFGDPVERDGITVIPVARLQWGFGGGSLGQNILERGGGGGGVLATPAGFIEIRDGKAEFRHYRDSRDLGIIASIALAALAVGLVLGRSGRG